MSIFPTKILLATDGSSEAELATRTAVDLAQKTDSELHMIHVVDVTPSAVLYPEATDPEGVEQPDPVLEEDLERHAEQLGREMLDGEVKRVRSAGGTVARSHLMMGEVAREIVHLAEDLGVGLIVIGSRGRGGIRRALMGSVSNSVIRHAHCPVLVVRGKPVTFPAKILLATDGSKEAELAASTTADLAKSTGSELHVVTVALEYPYVYAYYDVRHPAEVERHRQEARKVMDQQVDRVVEAGGNVAKTHVSMGVPDEEIVVLANELGADLVVLGSRGLGGMRRTLLGSVSDSVVRHAHCPVMMVRHEGGEMT
jgi:nucleotide-binding universal stress UspA family protein